MKNVFFKPNVGELYEHGFCCTKLLILGESHHCDKMDDECEVCGMESERVDCATMTQSVLNRYFDYKEGKGSFDPWMNTFSRFANVFFGDKGDNDEQVDFWNSVVFYNYVQSCVPESRQSPTKEQFEESKDAFFEVLSEYQPDLVIVWGQRLWSELPIEHRREGEEDILDNKHGKFYYYKVNNKEIPLYRVNHPSSSAFDYESSKYIQEAIRLTKQDGK